MTEMIRRLDYERRCKEWLKRRSKLNLETRECSQGIRLLHKKENRLLVQKLSQLDLALRLLKKDYKRSVQVVEEFQRKVSVRSVKFDSSAFRDETCGKKSGPVRNKGGRFFRRMTELDEEEEKTEIEKIMNKMKLGQILEKTEPSVSRSASPLSKLEKGLGLSSIPENHTPDIPEHNPEFKRSPSSVSFAVDMMPSSRSVSGSTSGYSARARCQPRPMSVTFGKPSQARLANQFLERTRRASTPEPRQNQSSVSRPLSANPSLQAPESRKSLSNDKRPLTASSRSSQRVTPRRQVSFTDMSSAVESDPEDEDRPTTADVILNKKSYLMMTSGMEGRSFKVLRDTYKGVYEEEMDPATKRVLALREGERQNLSKLQTAVKKLCTKLRYLKPSS